MIANRLLLLSVSVIAILVLSTVFVAIPITPRASAQAQLPREQRNWEYLNHNSLGTNFNPQTQINKGNAHLLELKWVYPIPSATGTSTGLVGFRSVNEGSIAPPLVVDGIVYVFTRSNAIIALDAKTGKNLWTFTTKFDNVTESKRLPISTSTHGHGIYFIDGKIWMNDFGCKVTAVDALTGKIASEFKDLCLNIPTNVGIYAGGGFGSHPPVIYKKGNIMIWGVGGSREGAGGGRMFVAGYDLTTKESKWMTHLMPPLAGQFPAERKAWGDWLVNNCKRGWIEAISACDIPQDILRNDWLYLDPSYTMWGMSNIWGQMAVDEDAGIVYLGTAQPGPHNFQSSIQQNPNWWAPGPRLFGSSVVALDARTGEIKWYHQTTARDLWDLDCSWNTILGNIGNRKVVFKGCKNGRVHALDAATGAAIWITELPAVKYSIAYCNAKCDNHRARGMGPWDLTKPTPFLDPRSKEDMNKRWPNEPSKGPYWYNPPASGAIEMDMAYDGKRVYAANKNDPGWRAGDQNLPAPFTAENNSTVTALDATTGRVVWEFFMPTVPYRGGLTVSGGMVFVNGWDGNLYLLDADTGKVLTSKNLGTGLDVQPTIGATTDGKMTVFQIFGGRAVPGRTAVPGALMAYGLPDKLPEPQVITKEVIKEVPRDVVREVIKEVPKEVVKEVIKEVPKEVIKEVTKTVTVETISPVSYAAIGVGVVLVVVAGVMMSRRKKA